MGNYSANDGSVQVSVFKPSGKWYTDIAVDMTGVFNHPSIHDGLEQVMRFQGHSSYVDNYICVCLNPYHRHSHPIMLKRMVENT